MGKTLKDVERNGYIIKRDGVIINKYNRIMKQKTDSFGYKAISLYIDKKYEYFLIHRLVGMKYLNLKDNEIIDHKYHNKKLNSVDDLRVCNRSQNNQNALPQKNKTSKYKGVYWLKDNKKYAASITVNKKVKYLGVFIDEAEAALRYNEEAQNHFGEYALLNKIEVN